MRGAELLGGAGLVSGSGHDDADDRRGAGGDENSGEDGATGLTANELSACSNVPPGCARVRSRHQPAEVHDVKSKTLSFSCGQESRTLRTRLTSSWVGIAAARIRAEAAEECRLTAREASGPQARSRTSRPAVDTWPRSACPAP